MWSVYPLLVVCYLQNVCSYSIICFKFSFIKIVCLHYLKKIYMHILSKIKKNNNNNTHRHYVFLFKSKKIIESQIKYISSILTVLDAFFNLHLVLCSIKEISHVRFIIHLHHIMYLRYTYLVTK